MVTAAKMMNLKMGSMTPKNQKQTIMLEMMHVT